MVELPIHRLMIHPLQLVGICPPLGQLCLVSQHITFRYTIKSIAPTFGPSTDYLVRVYPFLSFDPSAPNTALPAGTPLLSWLSPNPYLLGDDSSVSLNVNLDVNVKGTWLKAHIINEDAFPHTISVLITLQELEVD